MSYKLGSLSFDDPFSFDMALLGPVTSMIRNGFNIDIDKKNEFSVEYSSLWRYRQGKLNAVLGYELNVGSPKQVVECLYGDLGLPERKKNNEAPTR